MWEARSRITACIASAGAIHVLYFFPLIQAITLAECDVYSYRSDLETDPFGEALSSGPALLTVITTTSSYLSPQFLESSIQESLPVFGLSTTSFITRR